MAHTHDLFHSQGDVRITPHLTYLMASFLHRRGCFLWTPRSKDGHLQVEKSATATTAREAQHVDVHPV